MEFGFKLNPKVKNVVKPANKVFNTANKSESESESDEIKKTNKDLIKSSLYSQSSSCLASALAEDPTLVSYDLYKTKAELEQQAKATDTKDPKYHGNIKQHAEFRKRERMVLKERQEAKLRELEKDEFGETEEYFTQSYIDYMKQNKIFEDNLQQIDSVNEKTCITNKSPDLFLNKLICDPSEIPQKRPKIDEILPIMESEPENIKKQGDIDYLNDKRTDSQLQNARDRFLARKKQREG